ncbi:MULTISPECIES: DUF2530 domain-containing protein [unclassified Streptomyces]|uniref:DUF2530 domain-containing protein n=1 Tax=unclassified Streptomyces TaxID=2593676 RepID=UPI003321BE86
MAKWTPRHEAPEPLEGPIVGTVVGGTVLWFVLFLGQIPFYDWFDERDLLWWVWTCLAGAGLGLIGIWYVRGRDIAIKRAKAVDDATASPVAAGDTPGPSEPGVRGDESAVPGSKPESSSDEPVVPRDDSSPPPV